MISNDSPFYSKSVTSPSLPTPPQQTNRLPDTPPDSVTIRFGYTAYAVPNEPATLVAKIKAILDSIYVKAVGKVFPIHVPLTDEQKDVLDCFKKMEADPTNPTVIDEYFKILSNPSYAHLLYIRSTMFEDDEARNREMRLGHFQRPINILMEDASQEQQDALLRRLATEIAKTSDPEVLQNGVVDLVSLYFDQLIFAGTKGRKESALAKGTRKTIETLLTESPEVSLKAQRILQQELGFALSDFCFPQSHFNMPESSQALKDFAKKTMKPLLDKHINVPITEISASPAEIAQLFDLLRKEEDPAALLEAIAALLETLQELEDNGTLQKIIPELSRLADDSINYQHNVQVFTLKGHTFKALQVTIESPYYQKLTPEEKFRAKLAVLLHDIGKRTGPTNFRENGSLIISDYNHPARAAEVVRQLLPALGLSTDAIEDIVALVEHHQILPHDPPEKVSDAECAGIAELIGTESRLKILMALQEGDSGAVREGKAWVTKQFRENIEANAARISAFLPKS